MVRSSYELSDSGDRWQHTYREHHLKDFERIPTVGDGNLYYKCDGKRLIEISGAYVDGTLQAGTENFRNLKVFGNTKLKGQSVSFKGMQICETEGG